jgi:hypothetical protein
MNQFNPVYTLITFFTIPRPSKHRSPKWYLIFLISFTRATLSAHLILLDSITLIMPHKSYRQYFCHNFIKLIVNSCLLALLLHRAF